MFRKLTDRLSAAAYAAANAVTGGNEQGVSTLQSMGFNADDARNALQATNGNVDQAAELLLAGVSVPTTAQPTTIPTSSQEDQELARVLEASRKAEETRQLESARKASAEKSAGTMRPAPIEKAGEAAIRRAANGQLPYSNNKVQVCDHHPTVQVPAKLEQKSKEEQLLRCADRMKAYPRAVDTLYIALTSIQKDPSNDKFRKIDKTTPGYQRSLHNVPGALDMFKAMNFVERSSDELVMYRDQVDPALLYLGISALDAVRETPEYKEGKRLLQFAKQVTQVFQQSDASEEAAIQRANYMSKCPSEPSGGRGALISVKIADHEPVRRKFDGDDTVNDVLNWLGGISPTIPSKLLSREWSLVDLNRYPIAPMDCEDDGNKTLQHVGLFPSARLEILPSTEEWHLNKSLDNPRGSVRGLGAPPR